MKADFKTSCPRPRAALAAGLVAAILAAVPSIADTRILGTLPRAVDLQVAWGRDDVGVVLVSGVEPGSAAERAGLRRGDRIVGIDGAPLAPREPLFPRLQRLRPGRRVVVTVARGAERLEITFVPVAAALEEHPGVDTTYDDLAMPSGIRLRRILTRPAGASEPLPAILYVQWLSCSSVDAVLDPSGGWDEMIRAVIARSGAVVARIERAGVGDSEGSCAEQGFEDDLRMHRAALARLRREPGVDPARIFVFGVSIGARMAPLVGDGVNVAGYVTWGGGATPYDEYVLNHFAGVYRWSDRRPADPAAALARDARILSEFLVERRSPDQLSPGLRADWPQLFGVTPSGLLFGRSHRFHQEAFRADWRGAWARVDVPVLATYGEFDWFDTAASAAQIAAIVNENRPGLARFALVPRSDHHFVAYDDAESAFGGQGGRVAPEGFLEIVLPWLRERALPGPN